MPEISEEQDLPVRTEPTSEQNTEMNENTQGDVEHDASSTSKELPSEPGGLLAEALAFVEQTEVGQEALVPVEQEEVDEEVILPLERTEVGHEEYMKVEQRGAGQEELMPVEQTGAGLEELMPVDQAWIGQEEFMLVEQTEIGQEELTPVVQTEAGQEELMPRQPAEDSLQELLPMETLQIGEEELVTREPIETMREEVDDDWSDINLRPAPVNASMHGGRDSCPHTPLSDRHAGSRGAGDESDPSEAGEEAFLRSLRDNRLPSDKENDKSGEDSDNEEEKAGKDLLLLKAINARYLPAFANEENVILNDTVLEMELALKKAEEAVEEQDDRAAIMEEHMKRVQQEIYFSQSRHEAKRREIATEEHLCKIAEFEDSRLKGDMRKMTKETEEINERLHAFRTQIFKANERMDQFRLLMHWNQGVQSRRNWNNGHVLRGRSRTILMRWTSTPRVMTPGLESYSLKR